MESMNTVLCQELGRCNTLLQVRVVKVCRVGRCKSNCRNTPSLQFAAASTRNGRAFLFL
jgi:hypothetical protein